MAEKEYFYRMLLQCSCNGGHGHNGKCQMPMTSTPTDLPETWPCPFCGKEISVRCVKGDW